MIALLGASNRWGATDGGTRRHARFGSKTKDQQNAVMTTSLLTHIHKYIIFTETYGVHVVRKANQFPLDHDSVKCESGNTMKQ